MGRLENLEKRLDERLAGLEKRLDDRLAALDPRMDEWGTGFGMERGRGAPSAEARTTRPVRRIGVCVGLNEVDAATYPGHKLAPLDGCVADAERFLCVLKKKDFAAPSREGMPNDGPVKLLDRDATGSNVFAVLAAAAGELMPDDLFVFHISGHGGADEWCLYDGPASREDIIWAFAQFRPGVRILAINDQCFSGGIFQPRAIGGESPFALLCKKAGRPEGWNAAAALLRPDFPPVIQFAECLAQQTSNDGIAGGSWTQALLNVLETANAKGRWPTYQQWFVQAKASPTLHPGNQDPQWVESASVTDDFRHATAL